MSAIVLHKETGAEYLLVGTGYGMFKAARPGFFGGNLFPNEEEGSLPLAAVCDREGEIYWVPTNELQVVSVNGIDVKEYFSE